MVSIIVPVYNAEKYLRECIKSLISQTYSNIEIILVNDGSVDRSGDICKEYKQQDKRIIYIEQDNKGEGGARNAGLSISKGDYIAFCDSDDKLPKESIEVLIKNVNDADLVVGGIEKIEHNRLVQHIPSSKHCIGRHSIIECVRDDSYYMNPAVCKLYRRDIIEDNNIRFNNFKYGADTYFVYKYLQYAYRINFIDNSVYYVNVVENSMSTGVVKNSWDFLRAQYELIKDIAKDFDDIRHGILMNKIKAVLLLECRVSRDSFINTCEKIRTFIKKEDKKSIYKENLYNCIIYRLLVNKYYSFLYHLLCFRIRLGIRL